MLAAERLNEKSGAVNNAVNGVKKIPCQFFCWRDFVNRVLINIRAVY